MKIIFNKIIIVLLLGLFSLCVYSLSRNMQVSSFRNNVIDICYDYNVSDIPDKKINNAYLIYHSLPSYNDMVNSFKPLKLETYLDKDIVDELNRPYKDNLKNLK